MICPRCNQPTSRLIYRDGVTACANCRGLSDAAGASISGILTRNSERVRSQQHTFEGDTIPAHRYDKVLGRMVPNEDFMERFPNQITTYFTESELKKAGYSKPDKLFEAKAQLEADAAAERDRVEFVDDTDGEAMKDVIDATAS